MASSSVSQEDVENEFEISSRRTRIRSARMRPNNSARLETPLEDVCDMKLNEAASTMPTEHDASPKPVGRCKDKRAPRAPARQPLSDHVNRVNHLTKGKQRDRRKLREKRRSTGVVHLQSTESTGGSTGEDEDDPQLSGVDGTKVAGSSNEPIPEAPDRRTTPKTFPQRRTKSPSDLDADDEDNPNQSDSTASSAAQNLPFDALKETLDREKAENRRLRLLLEERDKEIVRLEGAIRQMLTENVSGIGELLRSIGEKKNDHGGH